METQTLTASVWREDNWFIAHFLEVDIASQGESEEEALVNLREAVELYFRVTSTKCEINTPKI